MTNASKILQIAIENNTMTVDISDFTNNDISTLNKLFDRIENRDEGILKFDATIIEHSEYTYSNSKYNATE